MKYYIDTIEQIRGEQEGTYTEYGKREKANTENAALSKFYTTLANVAADLDSKHTYMDIKITNSLGGIIKKDSVGTYMEENPVVTEE